MSWSFSFVADTADLAKQEIDKQQYLPEEFKTLLKSTIDTMVSKPQHHSAETMQQHKLRVESSGHHDGAGGWNSNGTYRISFEKVLR